MKTKLNSVLIKAFFSKKYLLIINIFIVFAYTVAMTSFTKMIGESFDLLIYGGAEKFYKKLAVLVILYLGLYYLSKLFEKKYYKAVITYTRKEIFRKTFDTNIKELLSRDFSYYSTGLINEINMLEKQFFEPVILTAIQIIGFIVTIYTLLSLDFVITCFILAASFLPIMLPTLLMPKLRKKIAEYSDSMKNYSMNINEMLDGYETFKIYGADNMIISKHIKINKMLCRKKMVAMRFSELVAKVANSSALFVVLGSLVLGMFLSINGKLTVGQVFTMCFLSANIMSPLSVISSNIPKVRSCKQFINKHIYEKKSEIGFAVKGISEKITVENLTLSFDKPILKGINLNIKKGKKYVFVGGSGSGKSTIVKSILGFYDNGGTIYYDGVKQADVLIDSVYENITYMPQSSHFFEGSIRENLLFFSETCDEKKLINALKTAMIEDMVFSLPEGLDTQISDNFAKISGGEKQRISIARALLRENDFIIMDEATSALDNKSFTEIEKNIASKDLTLVVVCHRLIDSVLEKYDEIIVVKDGNIVENGSFKKLMNYDSYFKALYNTQH